MEVFRSYSFTTLEAPLPVTEQLDMLTSHQEQLLHLPREALHQTKTFSLFHSTTEKDGDKELFQLNKFSDKILFTLK